jgi:hypothetical protein
MRCALQNITQTELCTPLTSFDWKEDDPSFGGTSSIDTTLYRVECGNVAGDDTADCARQGGVQLCVCRARDGRDCERGRVRPRPAV